MDYLFFYRCFYGQIYKEANFGDRRISAYTPAKMLEKEAESIDIGILEKEHDLWISFTH